MAKPTVNEGLNRIWGATGDVEDPDLTTTGKFSQGWTLEKPFHQHMNFVQKYLTQFLQHVNQEGIPVWDNETTYPTNAIVKGTDGILYKALRTTVDDVPASSPSDWTTLLSEVTDTDGISNTSNISGSSLTASLNVVDTLISELTEVTEDNDSRLDDVEDDISNLSADLDSVTNDLAEARQDIIYNTPLLGRLQTTVTISASGNRSVFDTIEAGMRITAAANTAYKVKAIIMYEASPDADDDTFSIRLRGPDNTLWAVDLSNTSDVALHASSGTSTVSATMNISSSYVDSLVRVAIVEGLCITQNSGAVNVQIAQSNTGTQFTVLENSFFILEPLTTVT